MRGFNKERVRDLLFEAARRLEPIDLFYNLVRLEVVRHEIGETYITYEIHLSFTEGLREIDLAAVDYGADVMPTFHLRNLSNGSDMNVREYISKTHGAAIASDLFKPGACSSEQGLRLFLERFFNNIRALNDKDFERIIAGEKWIDLSFDWHGYR